MLGITAINNGDKNMVGLKKLWFKLSVADVLEFFVVNTGAGLSDKEAAKRAKKFGYNKPLQISKSLRQHFKYSVLRDGKYKKIASDKLVLGDIIQLKKGNIVPCEVRLIKVNKLCVDEEHITGNYCPTYKNTLACSSMVKPNEQKNMLFAGTIIVDGLAMGVVVDYDNKSKIKASSSTNKALKTNNFIVNTPKASSKLKTIDLVIFDDLQQEYEVIQAAKDVYMQKNISCIFYVDKNVANKLQKSLPGAKFINSNSHIGKEVALFVSPSTSDKIKIAASTARQGLNAMYVYRGEVYEPAAKLCSLNLVVLKNSSQQSIATADLVASKTSTQNIASILYNKK